MSKYAIEPRCPFLENESAIQPSNLNAGWADTKDIEATKYIIASANGDWTLSSTVNFDIIDSVN